MKAKRIISLALAILLCINTVGCSLDSAKEKASSAASTVGEATGSAKETVTNTAVAAKDKVVDWYSNIDTKKFKQGWEYSIDFLGAKYSAVMSSSYISDIESQIAKLEADINDSMGSARGNAQEAGYLAEKWASDTFNINAVANGSKYRTEVVGSNEFASTDVKANWGESAQLKYYKTGTDSATHQAQSLLETYTKYRSNSKNPESLAEYMAKRGYDPNTQDALLASVYEGQTRIIPSDQMPEAIEFLEGRIKDLSATEGKMASARTKAYQETLENLKDRLIAPDGTKSKPLSRAEAQALAELGVEGKFKPEDFGVSVISVLSPKYVVKKAIGSGLAMAAMKASIEVGPDIYSILREAAQTGELDEEALRASGIKGAITATEGFVEGSVSLVMATLCKSGKLGPVLQEASPYIVASLTILVIEGAINGYDLAQGKITAEEYGNIMVDHLVGTIISIPLAKFDVAILPTLGLSMMIGCMGGSMMECLGLDDSKEAIMEIVDGGGFEAIVPVNTVDSFSIAKDKISSLNIRDSLSTFKDSVVSTANDGYIKVSTMIN